MTNTERSLTVGDAIAVAALLLFILGWLAIWGFGADWDEIKEFDGTEAVVALGIVFLPPLWAGALVSKVVDRKGAPDG